MHKTWRFVVLCAVILTMAAAAARAAEQPQQARDAKSVAQAGNAFAMDLYARLKGEEGNLFFSPYSISSALAMTYGGARGNTATEMADVLHFELDPAKLHPAFRQLTATLAASRRKGALTLRVANRLWGQQGYEFLPDFLTLTRENYGAGLEQVDFRGATEVARLRINNWVEKETEGKIKDLIGRGMLAAATRLVLTNAIYFKGDWSQKFDKHGTREAPFWAAADKSTPVPTMNQTESFGYTEDETVQALEMPYAGGRQSMVVLLPKVEEAGKGAAKLAELEKDLTAEKLAGWLGKLRGQQVRVSLPKFKFTSEFELSDLLKAMGMRDAFDLARADFTGMTKSPELYIAKVIHKAFVDVYEEGTEAAAATAVVMEAGAMPMQPPVVFRADHPFLFLIRDRETGTILFMGRVANPQG